MTNPEHWDAQKGSKTGWSGFSRQGLKQDWQEGDGIIELGPSRSSALLRCRLNQASNAYAEHAIAELRLNRSRQKSAESGQRR